MLVFLSLFAVAAAFGFCFYILVGPGRAARFPMQVVYLLLFSLVEIFDLLALHYPDQLFYWKNFSVVGEALMAPAVVAFALTFYRTEGLARSGLLARAFLVLSPLFLGAVVILHPQGLFFSPDFSREKLLFLTYAGFFFYVGLMVYQVFALVLMEQTLVSLAVHERWAVKFEMIGAGLLPVAALIYYSQGLLYRSLDMGLLPTRSAALLLGVGLMLFSRLKRGAGRPISVSRSVAFHSLVIMALGVYLLGLGLLGEGMRYLGISSQKNFFIIIAILTGCGLLTLLLSETLRRKVNVFLHKNFFRNKYDYRVQWLEFTRRLSQAATFAQLQTRVLAFFCETFGFNGATLYLRDPEAGAFLAVSRFLVAPGPDEISQDDSLVQSLEEGDWIYNAADGPVFPVASDRVSLVVPLPLGDRLEGMIFCGPQINSEEDFTYEDYDLLKALARQTTSALVTQRLFEELGAAREMAAMGKVSAFVMHDLKNQVSSLSLLVENAADYLDDPEFQQDLLETLSGTIARMRKLMERLKNLRVGLDLDLAETDLVRLVEKIVAGFEGETELVIEKSPVMLMCDSEKLGTVLLNLLLNALEADPQQRPVKVGVGVAAAGERFFRVRDEGAGMSAEFISSQLFKPFVTTKKKGLGIGLYQCRQIVEAHGGRIEVESEVGRGSVFTVLLPEKPAVAVPREEEL